VLNSRFLELAYGPDFFDEYGWVCTFSADPNAADGGAWKGAPYWHAAPQQRIIDNSSEDNTYYSVAVFTHDKDGKKRRSKDNFSRLAVLVADDIVLQDLEGRQSYRLETSKGCYQVGMFLDPADPDCKDLPLIDRLMQRMAENKLVKQDASGVNAVRYVRLPNGRNKKASRNDWQCILHDCDDEDIVYPLKDAAAAFGINLDGIKNEIPQLSIASKAEQFRDSVTVTGETAQLYQTLFDPDPRNRSYHDPLLRLSAQMVASGMNPGAVVNHLRGIMLANMPSAIDEPEQFARHSARMDEIARMTMAARKYAPPALELDSTDLLINQATLRDLTKDIRWLVDDLIPADAMGMAFGASGTFKSFVALDLLMHIAHGKRWMDRDTDTGPVVYMAAEGGAGIARRLDAWSKYHNIGDSPNVNICIVPLLLSLEEQVEAFRGAIHKLPYKPKCVVIDTLAQTFAGDENSSSDISHYLRLLNGHIRAAFNATVIVIHHTGHAVTERPRGSSALTANLDFMVSIAKPTPDSLHCIMDATKQKDGEKLKNLMFKMHPVDLGKTTAGKPIGSLVAAHCDVYETLTSNGKGLGKTAFEKAMFTAMEKNPEGVGEIDASALRASTIQNPNSRGSAWTRFEQKFIYCDRPVVEFVNGRYRRIS